jgi:hypothetical protein
VCFEHPGLLAEADDSGGRSTACVTCSDEGRLAEVVRVEVDGTASARTPEGIERIDVSLVDPVEPDDLVLVHAGTAIAIVEASRR